MSVATRTGEVEDDRPIVEAGPTLAARLGASRLPARDAVRVALDVARELAALHAAGAGHGDVHSERVLLREGGGARLAAQAPGACAPKDDLCALAALLDGALPLGELPAPDAALRAGAGRVVAWLRDPGPAGARTAEEAERALWAVLRDEPLALERRRGFGEREALPLAAHRLALRAACQGAGAGLLFGVPVLLGGPATALSCGAAFAAAAAALALAEEVGRTRPAWRWGAALLFAALAPPLAIACGGVAWTAVSTGEPPIAALGDLLGSPTGSTIAELLLGLAPLGAPCLVVARARMAAISDSTASVLAGAAAAPVALLSLYLVTDRRPGSLSPSLRDLTIEALSTGIAVVVVALWAMIGLALGRRIERAILERWA